VKRYYFDANALIKYYKSEKGSDQIIDLVKIAKPILISQLTFLETISVFIKFRRKKLIRKRQLDDIVKLLKQDIEYDEKISSFQMISLHNDIFQLAESILLENADAAIQTNDALHLAIVKKQINQTIMVTSDNSLKNVCERIEIESYNPESAPSNT